MEPARYYCFNMDLYGQLQLKWAVGYKGLHLHYIDDSTLVYSCGNTLSFVKDDGKLVCSLQSEGRGLGPLAVCSKASLVAYAEATLNPKIFVLSFPSCKLESTLEGGAHLEYTCLAFSADGKRLASLSGVPDFKLTLWDCNDCSEICSVNVGSGCCQLSFNPLNWKQLCLLGPNRVTLWNLEQCDTHNFLSPMKVILPDKSSPVGPVVKTSTSATEVKPKPDRRATHGDHGTQQLFTPPNMSKVLYEESYNDFMRKKQPVQLKTHCWTPQQSIYVGCAGGQLLLVEFDSGAVQILINPQLTDQDSSSFQSLSSKISEEDENGAEDFEPPKTGHAVLGENSIDVMVLSRDSIFTAGKNGVINRFELNKEFTLADSLIVDQPVASLIWSVNYDKLVVGTEEGKILKLNPQRLNEDIALVSNHHHSQIVGIDVLAPGNKYCFTCRENGLVQLWDIQDGTLVSTINLSTKCSCLTCPMSCHLAVVGSTSGYLYMLSYTDPTTPRLVEMKFMHDTGVRFISTDQCGQFIVSASADGLVFVYNAKPSSQFAVVGYLGGLGEVLDLSLLASDEQNSEPNTKVSVLTTVEGKQQVGIFQIAHSVIKNAPPELYSDATKHFSMEFVSWRQAELTEGVSSFTLVPGNKAVALLSSTFEHTNFDLSVVKEGDPDCVLLPDVCYKGHELDGGKAVLSFHQKWVASIASDGVVFLRLLEKPEKTLSCNPHHYQNDFSNGIVFSIDSHSLLTTGDIGTVTCWKMKFSEHASVKGSSAAEYANRFMRKMESIHNSENTILSGLPSIFQPLEEENGKTWLQLAKEEAYRAEDEKYAENKAQLRQEISNLREKVLTMIATNDQLPDIEKLERHEFILDTEEHQRLQAEEEQMIQEVRDEEELSNLATMFTRQCVKQDCWDNMKVKGIILKSFQSHIEVCNYPLKSRSEAVLKEVEKIKTLRAIELAERKIRNEVGASLKQTLSFRVEDSLLEEEDILGETKEKQQQSKEEESAGDPDSLIGSHAAQVGGGSELLLEQFDLHSPVGKKHQIVLMEDCIYRMKETFNKEFDEVFLQKESEIARIAEKNIRISKIINQLKLEDKLVQPKLDSEEEPQRLLTVDDKEVTVEKYVPPEEKKRLEEVAKQEELKRLAEMGDNPRERALDMMMGGRLEANVEEDIFKDLPRPDFMAKDPAEMSEDEIRLAREFEKKEEAFLEEREKMKKALEAELRKLQGTITQGMEQFDERLQKLFDLKIRTETAIHQEELKVLHLLRSLLLEKQVTLKSKLLNQLLEEKKVEKVKLGGIISNAKRTVSEFREQYEQMAAEDKEFDKSFKRDFADCEPYVDQLYKLFRKRPKGYRLKPGPSDGTVNLVSDPKSQNPFAMRPSSVAKGERGLKIDGDDPMLELDDTSYMPEGLESVSSWERFVVYRRRKMESEKMVKTMALKLAEMNAFLQKRQTEDEDLQQEIQDIFKDLNKLQEDKTVFDLNLEIQLLLKQGQVEVDMGEFVPDFSDSILIHRSAIEELNNQIKTLGGGKLHSMLECKDFKQGIHMLEWEHKKLQMEAEDLIEKAKDIQMLRVTKELQQRLMEENVASKDQNEIETLEKTIELNQAMHRKTVRERKRALGKLQQEVSERYTQNKELENQVLEYQILVAERDIVENLAGIPPSEANREQRMHDIVTRRRLVETVKAQDHQISVLRSELERLRMRTFPALVQVD